VTPGMIEERAREIARGDGRSRANDLDRTRAREELTGPTSGSDKPPTREEPGREGNTTCVVGRESSDGAS
jgi:hypothetical protein